MATTHRKLRTGHSIWEGRRGPAVAARHLTRDIRTDVLVIGAGITGALVADALAAAGLAVVVVDKRGPARGSTTASTALVQYDVDVPLTKLTRKIGKDKAVRAWRRSRLAVEALAVRFAELNVPDVVRRDSLYLAGDALGKKDLEREHAARRAIGLPDRLLDRKALRARFGIDRAAAIMGHGNLVIDPRISTFAILKAAAANGVHIHSPVEVTAVEPHRSGVTAQTDKGHCIRCDRLVFATGYEVPHAVPRRHHKITSTWAIATVRQARSRLWPGECSVWEASDPYLYLRTTADGRVICGGEDEEFSDAEKRDALLGRKTTALQRKLQRLLPRLDATVELAWAGTFGETTTGLPMIGPVPAMKNCFIALGYGGNGTTYAAIAADVVAGAICGKPDVDADLYEFPAHAAAG